MESKLRSWSVLAFGIVLAISSLILSRVLHGSHILSNYLEDIAADVTVIVLSIATYEEWMRRRERGRYKASEQMGARRIKDEVFQLIYQYAYVLNMRWDPDSEAMQSLERTDAETPFHPLVTELHAKTAKHITQEDVSSKSGLFDASRLALANPLLTKQTYRDVDQLIAQTERAIGQIDMTIAVYGYSFSPEVHKWALDVREGVSQCVTGKLSILSIRLNASSKVIDTILRPQDRVGITRLTNELIAVGELSDRPVESA